MQGSNLEATTKVILSTLRKRGGAAPEPVLRSAVRDRRAFAKAMLYLIDKGLIYVNYCEKPPVVILIND